jgi:hypothetical protein
MWIRLYDFLKGIFVFFWLMGSFAFRFAGCSLSGKACLCQLTKAPHMTFPITCAAIIQLLQVCFNQLQILRYCV